ncbi:MAG: BlaI/MecI/CopY family transcriptional regulator [Chloroflexota bacterium]|nr:BlaI/MecI/CopY family transcriptional regulator [Chloroflexota bacterium]
MTSVKNLTALQMTVMNVLWQLGEATVAQVHAAVQEKRQLALTTVATVLSRLEKYGLLSHRTEGRQYVYRPLVSRDEVRRSQLSNVVDHLFEGNPADLVYHLINEADVDDDDLARIGALIESKEKENTNDSQ